MKNQVEVYEAPVIKVVEVHVESGFACSNGPTGEGEDMPWG